MEKRALDAEKDRDKATSREWWLGTGFQHQLPDMLGHVKKRVVCEIFVI